MLNFDTKARTAYYNSRRESYQNDTRGIGGSRGAWGARAPLDRLKFGIFCELFFCWCTFLDVSCQIGLSIHEYRGRSANVW